MTEGDRSDLAKNDGVLLTLGDGDFSFSADLVTFCRQQEPRQATTIYATGLDSKSELDTKYKNARFLMSQLQSDAWLNVEVHHVVNAVQPPRLPLTASHVIFNHPHLATEDAQRHSRFLAHFFHASSLSWMAPDGGLVHVALAKGQCERWKCLEMAERQGLTLVERNVFVPPPVKDPKYQHRRHQTGKSFSRRTNGSETLSFARTSDLPALKTTCLPWQHLASNEKQEIEIPCPHCERIFLEDRALRSHVQAVHGGGSKKRQREDALVCVLCANKRFLHENALQDHIRAKHSVHTKILPEWAAEVKHTGSKMHQGERFGECAICAYVYQSPADEHLHTNEFIPDFGPCTEVAESHKCMFCSKTFVDQRAKQQHENYCSSNKASVKESSEASDPAYPDSISSMLLLLFHTYTYKSN